MYTRSINRRQIYWAAYCIPLFKEILLRVNSVITAIFIYYLHVIADGWDLRPKPHKILNEYEHEWYRYYEYIHTEKVTRTRYEVFIYSSVCTVVECWVPLGGAEYPSSTFLQIEVDGDVVIIISYGVVDTCVRWCMDTDNTRMGNNTRRMMHPRREAQSGPGK